MVTSPVCSSCLSLLSLALFFGTSLAQTTTKGPFELDTRILIKPPDIFKPCPKIREGVTSLSPGSKNITYSYLAIEDDPEDESALLAIDGCPENDPLDRPLLRKCCPMKQAVADESGSCALDPAPRQPFSPGVAYNNGSRWEVDALKHFILVFWRPCHQMLDPVKNPAQDFTLRGSDGRLGLPRWNGSIVDAGDFCVDYVVDRSTYAVFLCSPSASRSDARPASVAESLYPIALLISAPFLFATFLVHACIRELRNIHGKNLMCLVGSYFISFLFLALGLLGLDGVSMDFCVASAFITEYSFLAAFFWLNVICLDIFLTFSGVCPMRDTLGRSGKIFLYYSIYAWGVPFVIFSLSLIFEFAPGIPDSIIKPEFGVTRCWFKSGKALAAYFYGPIALVLISNLVMYIWTAVSLFKMKKQSASLRADDDGRQRFNLYLKLFIIMGVNWMMELIQTVVKGPDYLWVVCDLLNALQGVFIFFIFVWKKKVRGVATRRICQMLPEKFSSGSQIMRSLNPWQHKADSADPSQSDNTSREHTLSTPVQSTASREPEELRTLTMDMK
ncbi:G-protein coupled receptor Mth2-like [Ischnura elegans]|uniref:G-protein coupled receptor Mth2-like n=1 Tax=Ischnura elegans TaxID=197161 RepID=UPI001ED8946E|nr:G-protein coupled receptor Mth2-like [Ischnura elegans]